MKKWLIIVFACISFIARAQDAVLHDHEAFYKGSTYSEGDIVHLGYGSAADKDFSFIHYGKAPAGMKIPGIYRKANADWSKAEIKIEKVYSEKGVVWIRGEPINRGKGGILGNKIYMNLAGAVDNKEIVSVAHATGTKGRTEASPGKWSAEKSSVSALSASKMKLKQSYDDTKEKLKSEAGNLKLKWKGKADSLKQSLATGLKTLETKGKAALDDGNRKLKGISKKN